MVRIWHLFMLEGLFFGEERNLNNFNVLNMEGLNILNFLLKKGIFYKNLVGLIFL